MDSTPVLNNTRDRNSFRPNTALNIDSNAHCFDASRAFFQSIEPSAFSVLTTSAYHHAYADSTGPAYNTATNHAHHNYWSRLHSIPTHGLASISESFGCEPFHMHQLQLQQQHGHHQHHQHHQQQQQDYAGDTAMFEHYTPHENGQTCDYLESSAYYGVSNERKITDLNMPFETYDSIPRASFTQDISASPRWSSGASPLPPRPSLGATSEHRTVLYRLPTLVETQPFSSPEEKTEEVRLQSIVFNGANNSTQGDCVYQTLPPITSVDYGDGNHESISVIPFYAGVPPPGAEAMTTDTTEEAMIERQTFSNTEYSTTSFTDWLTGNPMTISQSYIQSMLGEMATDQAMDEKCMTTASTVTREHPQEFTWNMNAVIGSEESDNTVDNVKTRSMSELHFGAQNDYMVDELSRNAGDQTTRWFTDGTISHTKSDPCKTSDKMQCELVTDATKYFDDAIQFISLSEGTNTDLSSACTQHDGEQRTFGYNSESSKRNSTNISIPNDGDVSTVLCAVSTSSVLHCDKTSGDDNPSHPTTNNYYRSNELLELGSLLRGRVDKEIRYS